VRRMYDRSLSDRWKDLKMVLWKPWLTVQYGDITVHYKHRLEGGGQEQGQDLVQSIEDLNMPRQGRVFEWCAGPGFIGFSLLARGHCDSLCLADINPYAVKAARRTVGANALEDRVAVYLSDGLEHIPESERWDLVVATPVHFADRYEGSLRAHDPDWRIHREFYENVTRFLNPGGVILIQECWQGSTPQTFKPMIEDSGLKIVYESEPAGAPGRAAQFYNLASMRAGDTVPDWLR
jgi:methylase of polypeptide subunit release factors